MMTEKAGEIAGRIWGDGNVLEWIIVVTGQLY